MKMKSFGVVNQAQLKDNDVDRYVEELSILGYSIIEDVLTDDELKTARIKLDEVYAMQVKEFSEEELGSINELYMARMPFVYDDYFLSFITNEKLINVVKAVLGNYFVLHLQNGIINMPDRPHHQNSWHRDLPYQDFTSSAPLAISALYCIDNFDESTGGTIVIPHTHKLDHMPSEQYIQKHSAQVTAKAGALVLFDSMVFHRAGYNASHHIRRGLNHMFTTAILKQQINIPSMLNGKYSDEPFLRMLMGYDACPPGSVAEWRRSRINKKNN